MYKEVDVLQLNNLKKLLDEVKNELEYGWDIGINYLNLNISNRNIPLQYSKVLKNLIKLYWSSYEFDGLYEDIDSGVCGIIRSNVINLILDIENELWR